jgi:hypothetical protein
MVNLSIVVPKFRSFFLENDHIGDVALTTSFFIDWFFKKTKFYCLDLKRIGSLSMDTCATMQKTWTSVEEHPLLKHAFVIPCDSHGL